MIFSSNISGPSIPKYFDLQIENKMFSIIGEKQREMVICYHSKNGDIVHILDIRDTKLTKRYELIDIMLNIVIDDVSSCQLNRNELIKKLLECSDYHDIFDRPKLLTIEALHTFNVCRNYFDICDRITWSLERLRYHYGYSNENVHSKDGMLNTIKERVLASTF